MGDLKKYKRTQVKRILAHMQRIGKISNRNVDPSRTVLNENLMAATKGEPEAALRKRLEEIHVMNRSDIVILASWVFTLPKDCMDEQSFFQCVVAFLSERYQPENVIGAFIHRDESQPHLHLLFTPSIYDSKKKYEKLCANSVLTRNDLRTIHRDLQDYLIKHGVTGTVYTGITAKQGGNIPVKRLKLKLTRSIDRKRDVQEEHEIDMHEIDILR